MKKPADAIVPGRLSSHPAGFPQLYPWRSAVEQRARAREAQIAEVDALLRRHRRVLRLVPPSDSFRERARAAQRRGFNNFLTRLGGGHLY